MNLEGGGVKEREGELWWRQQYDPEPRHATCIYLRHLWEESVTVTLGVFEFGSRI